MSSVQPGPVCFPLVGGQGVRVADMRVADMEDEWAIRRVLEHYCRFNDDGDVDRLVRLFTRDARLRAMGQVLEGHDQIRSAFPKPPPDAPRRPMTQHQLSNVVVDRVGDETHVESDWAMLMRDAKGAVTVAMAGRFRDRFEKDAEGDWKIAEREILSLARPSD